MLLDWSPTWETHPQITSSTISGSTPVRSSSSLRTTADRSAACMPDKPAVSLPDRGAHRLDDDCLTHISTPIAPNRWISITPTDQ